MFFNLYILYSNWKLSALREIALAQEIRSYGVESMKYQYMGECTFLCSTSESVSGKRVPVILLTPMHIANRTLQDFTSILAPR